MRLLRALLRRLISEESGQSLVVVVSSMTVLVGIAAFGIDAATWMAKHHRAQLVADSAALAAAQCLANPGQPETINGTPVPACTSSSDTADADTVAIDYAAANGVTITAGDVTVAGTKVTVDAQATSSGFFSNVSGISSTSQTAAAAASWTSTSSVCTNPGPTGNCDFMFAHDSDCSSAMNGIYITDGGNTTVDGNIQSNGNISGSVNGNVSLGYGSFGPNGASMCGNLLNSNGHNPWIVPPTQAPTDIPYPIDYTKDFPACGGSGQLACQSNGYPSFCTNSGANITLTGSTNGDTTIPFQIYCASGTGQLSDPSTWNGTIQINLSGKVTLYDTFVGGSINFNGNGKDVLNSCGYAVSGYTASNCAPSVPAPLTPNYPIFYATGNCSTALDVQIGGGQTINGDMFAPNGTALLSMNGNKTLTTFIEAQDINASMGGTLQGDGPTANNTGSSAGGNVQLIQ
jgi:hypothetical protein